MNDVGGSSTTDEAFEALKVRADTLERQLQEAESQAAARMRDLELKTEAVRAGIVDLDGLRLIDPRHLTDRGDEPDSAAVVIGKLRRDKPWLFGVGNSSSVATTPAAAATKRKLATDMTVEEWRTARSELLRHR